MKLNFKRLKEAAGYLDPGYFNARNTAKTSAGFMGSILLRALPEPLQSGELTSIFNYVPISPGLATSGQPNEKQLAAIRRAGFSFVINLAPHHAENALPDEPGIVTGLGMTYVHIPVDFKNPTETDFRRFCEAMANAGETPVFVHCAANMRVSAFIYRYRTNILGENPANAQTDLNRIWEPFGVWATFINRDASS